ncbi:MAG: translocation/assembly module TamB domain-containing protein [Bacteroidota bacterium]|nr:translocation/assembly module TamB domain-containing protein [Bacteroidota bacterium]
MTAKISKIARLFILLLLFSIGLLYIIFRSSPFQTWIVNKACNWLSDEVGATVSISGVDIDFFKTAVFENVFVEDLNHDTLFYFGKLKVDYHSYDKIKHIIKLNYISLEDGKVYLGQHKGNDFANYQFFIDFFDSGPRDPNKPKIIWTIYSENVHLDNMRFDYFDRNEERPDFLDFIYTDFSFKKINGNITDFYLIDDSLNFKINKLSTIENCGLRVIDVQAHANIHAKGIEFNKLFLKTPKSILRNQFSMKTQNWKSYNNFNDSVYMKGFLDSSVIHSDDLAYFSHNFKEYHTRLIASGGFEGFLTKIKGKNTNLSLFEKTNFRGDWSMTGLPDFENTILDFDVKSLTTIYEDINAISMSKLPENFKSLGIINYKGQFSGFFNDFITFGHIKTELGDFDTDLNLKFKNGLDNGLFKGKLISDHFKLQTFIPFSPVDNLSFNLNIVGQGFSEESFDFEIDGIINELFYNQKSFKNIEATGKLKKDFYSGTLLVKDPNLDFAFDGFFKTDKKVPEGNFNLDVKAINLFSLGLDTINHIIKGDFVFNFTGNSIDDMLGVVSGNNISINRNNHTTKIPNLMLTSNNDKGQKEIRLLSEPIDIYLDGDFKLSKLNVSIINFAHQLLPAFVKKPDGIIPDEDFEFLINIKQPDQLSSLYLPKVQFTPFNVNGYYHSLKNEIKVESTNKAIKIGKYEVSDIQFSAIKNQGETLNITLLSNGFTDFNNFLINDIDLRAKVEENRINFNLNAKDTSWKMGLNTSGEFKFFRDSVYLNFDSTYFALDQEFWQLENKAFVLFESDKIQFNQFVFKNQTQKIEFSGEFGEMAVNDILFNLDNFDVKNINYFILDKSIPKFAGITNGNIRYASSKDSPGFVSDLLIKTFVMGADTLGDFSLVTSNNSFKEPQRLKINVLNGLLDSLKIEGLIDYQSKTDNLNLSVILPKTQLRVFQPFLKGIFSQMEGIVYTRDSLKVTGTFDGPDMVGDIIVEKAFAVIDYLNVPISFSTVIKSKKNKFEIVPFEVFDLKGNKGQVAGNVLHQSFKEYQLNLNIRDLNNFLILNTKSFQNSLYYGQAYMSGNASINGPFDKLDIRIDAKTMPNTFFYLPISDGEVSDLPSFVHFKTLKKKVKGVEDDFPLNSLVIDIEATSDAQIEIIFDETLGDKIKGSGNGNLKMEMNSNGDFSMFGSYKVTQGKYLFTAFDIYNKPFFIRPGGTITWYGDPLDAKLDIVAFNSERASSQPFQLAFNLNNNLQGNTGNVIITAESELYLKGNLFSPEISFGLNFPRLQYEAPDDYVALQSVIGRIKADKDEVSRQVFSLLIMKQFLTPTFAEASLGVNNVGSQALSTAGSELLSAQLSNWLNKIDPNWSVNIIYKNGNITLPLEYGLMLSKRFLNDKLTFDGSISNLTNRPNINLEYRVTKKGNIKIKAYTRSNFNQVNTTSLNTPITTNGVGIVYTKEFNRFFNFRKKKKKKNEIDLDTNSPQ